MQMKKETATQKRYTQLYKLVNACLERYGENEMLSVFSKITGNEYIEAKDKDTMVYDLTQEGYCIFKPDNSNQGDKLKEYAETYIFPYYNEQMTAILF